MKAKEAEIIRQMQQSPKQFDPSKLKIDVECPEPRDIASGMSYKIQNKQPVAPKATNRIPKPARTQEKFENTWIQKNEVKRSPNMNIAFQQCHTVIGAD